MAIYYIIYGVLLFLTLIFEVLPFRLNKQSTLILYVIVGAYLVCFAGFRTVGYDYAGYKMIFELISNLEPAQIFSFQITEYGYTFSNWLLRGYSYSVLVFFTACLAVLPKLIYFYKRCDDVFIALLVYYCMNLIGSDTGQIRQGIACGICLYALDEVSEGRLIKFILLVLLASSFHITAVFFLLMPFIRNKHYGFRQLMMFLCVCFLLSMMGNLLVTVANIIAPFAGQTSFKIIYYLSIAGTFSWASLLSIIKNIPLLFIFSYLVRPGKSAVFAEKTYSRLLAAYNCFYVSIALNVMILNLGAFGRITNMFRITQIYLLSEVCYLYGREFRISGIGAGLAKVLLIGYTAVFCVMNMTNHITFHIDTPSNGYVPYSWSLDMLGMK